SGRIPVRASATMRMMSPARLSRLTSSRVAVANQVPAVPQASVPDASAGVTPTAPVMLTTPTMPMPTGGTSPGSGLPADRDSTSAASALANGFLAIGSDRAYPRPPNQPADHPALCNG